jgi:aminopeptidase YwaD
MTRTPQVKLAGFVLVILALVPPCLYSQNKLLIPASLRDSILSELSGLRAMNGIYSLCTFDRSGASKGLYDAQMWVLETLRSWGIEDVRIDDYPADGEKLYLDTHPAGYAWEKKGAVLTLVEPYAKKIIDYEEIPTALVQYSNSADIIAELVDVGSGLAAQDYLGKDVEGKIVFASGPAWSVYPLANKKFGAIGIVSYWENLEPERSRFPDQVPWMSIPQEVGTPYFGFSISRNIGDELKRLISSGKTVVHAKVDAEVKRGTYHVLSSAIKGTDLADQEILLMAHINHHKPAANDNASGCALLMEIERSIKNLIQAGKIPPPRRTIRFIWMNEHVGSKIYLDSRPELSTRGVLAMNLDMVGENVLLTESVLRATLAPHSCPSFLDDLVLHLLSYVSGANIVERQGTKIPFTFWAEKYNGAISDHYWYLSGGIAIPTSFLYFNPDNFFHCQEDTPDKCDPTMLKRIGFVAMATALYAASAGEQEARDLSSLVWAESSKRIIQAAKEAQDSLKSIKTGNLSEALKESHIKLDEIHKKEDRSLRSIFRLSTAQNVMADVQKQCASLMRLTEGQQRDLEAFSKDLLGGASQSLPAAGLTAEEKKMAHILPIRHFRGPINLGYVQKRVSEKKSQWYDDAAERIPDFFVIQDEIANFIDNKNSILDIRNAVAAEFGPIDLKDVYDFIDGIQEAGLVTYLNK